MLDKIKNINFKKTSIRFITIAVIAVVLCGLVNLFNFGSRIPIWESQIKMIKSEYRQSNSINASVNSNTNKIEDYRKNKHGEDSEHNDAVKEEIKSVVSLSTVDKVILGASGAVVIVIAAAYWILVVLWMIKRSYLDGANVVIVGIAALLFNVLAVAGYYVYRSLVNRCPACGKIQKKDAEYCSNCGTNIIKTCEKCGAKIKTCDRFCNKCGNKQL